MSHIPERDRQTFRTLKDELLDIAGKRTLDEVVGLIDEKGDKPHDAYEGLSRFSQEIRGRIPGMLEARS